MPKTTEPKIPQTAKTNAVRDLVESIDSFGQVFVTKMLKVRSHRKPTAAKVNEVMLTLIDSGWFELLYLEFSHIYQSHINKPCANRTREENIQEMECASLFFKKLSQEIDRPRGRPSQRRIKSIGSIFDQMSGPGPAKSMDKLGTLVEEFLNLEKSYKIGLFACQETSAFIREGQNPEDTKLRLGSLDAALEYINEMDDDEKQSAIGRRMPAGELRRLFLTLGGDMNNFDAFKKRVSRAHRNRRNS